jgi:hypothetical protein
MNLSLISRKELTPNGNIEKTNEQGQIQKQLIHGDEQKQFSKRPFSSKSWRDCSKNFMHYAYAKILW